MKRFVYAIAVCAPIVFGTAVATAQESVPASATPVQVSEASERAPAPAANAADAAAVDDIVVVGAKLPPKNSIEKVKTWVDDYLPYQQRVAGWVDNTARGIDSFFGTDDAWRIDNNSWLRLTSDLGWEQGQGVGSDLRARVKIDVPTAQKRLRILFESDPPDSTVVDELVTPSQDSDNAKRTTVLGLGTNFEGWIPEWKKQFQVGVRFALPIDPYARFIARRDVPLGGKWELNSYNRVSWFYDDGYSVKSALKFGEPLAPNWRHYYSTNLLWREKNDYLEFVESANLTNILSTHSAVTYSLGFSGTGWEVPQIDKYFLTANYRRNLGRRLLFVDVIPELSFPEAHDFDPRWAITLRLELYFQKKIAPED